MKRAIVSVTLSALSFTATNAAAADPPEERPPCSVRGDGALQVIPAVGGVFATSGSSRIEERLGAGVQLGGVFGWQICRPALFLGVGATFTAFDYYGTNDAARARTSPQFVDAFLTARLTLWRGLFIDALGGLTSSAVIRDRALVPSGATNDRSQAPFTGDIPTDAGPLFGVGLGYAIQIAPGPYDHGKAAFAIGLDARIHVFSSGTVVTWPVVISVPLPLD